MNLEPILYFLLLLVVVLVLIALSIWLVRYFLGARMSFGFNRNRQPRLNVVDAIPIDSRRRLVLVRRDQFEHLLLIGGDTDIVVEQTIFRGLPLNARIRPEQLRGAASAPPPPSPTPEQSAPPPRAEAQRVAAQRQAPPPAAAPQPPPFLRRGEAGPAGRSETGRREVGSAGVPPQPPRPEPTMAGPGRGGEPRGRSAEPPARTRGPIESLPPPNPPAVGPPPPAPLPRSGPASRRVEEPVVEPPRPLAIPEDAPQPTVAENVAPTDSSSAPLPADPAPAEAESDSTAAQINSLEQEMARLLGELTGKKN